MILARPCFRYTGLCFLLAVLLVGCNPIAQKIPPPRADQPFVCPVTQPTTPPFTAPAPYPPPPDGYFWHGADALWTGLPLDGVWWGLPKQADGSFGQKLFVWRAGYDPVQEPQPALIVSGRRLDGDAPPLTGHIPATHAFAPDIHSAMLTGLTIPAAGCWEVTATYAAANGDSPALTFVVAIEG